MNYCYNCGNKLEEQAKFCGSCGNQLGESPGSVEVQTVVAIQEYKEPIEVIHRGTEQFPLIEFLLDKDCKATIENGSMVYHNGKVKIEGRMNNNGDQGVGGVLKAVGRSVVSGEAMFITDVYGTGEGGRITIAPPTEGRVIQVSAGEDQWFLNDGVFLASTGNVSIEIRNQSITKSLFGGTGGFFIQETKGTGQVFFSAYGDIEEIDFDSNESELVVDNEHVVAWQNTLDYTTEVASGTMGVMSGEGVVLRFRGKGKLYIQTRSFDSLKQKIAID